MKLITQGKKAKEELMIIEPINIMQWEAIVQVMIALFYAVYRIIELSKLIKEGQSLEDVILVRDEILKAVKELNQEINQANKQIKRLG